MKRVISGCALVAVAGCVAKAPEVAVGSMIVDVAGHLEPALADQPTIFRVDRGDDTPAVKSFPIEPNVKLAMMQEIGAETQRNVSFRVTGTLTAQGTLLIDKVALLHDVTNNPQR